MLPIYRQKLAEIDDQSKLPKNIKSNLEDRIRSILDGQKNHEQEEGQNEHAVYRRNDISGKYP